jgi:hypothetical protein
MAVAALLLQIRLHGEAAMMPDHRAWHKTQHAVLAQPPADIDIIPGGHELGTEAADAFKRVFADGEIAAGQVLGLGVVEQHMRRCSGCGGDDAFDVIARRWRDVWPAGGHDSDHR